MGLLFAGVVVVAGLGGWLFPSGGAVPVADQPVARVVVGGHVVRVHVAGDEADRDAGLSDEGPLGGWGEWFVFPSSGRHLFWMAGMRYRLDVVWVSAGWRVVGLWLGARPCGVGGFCRAFGGGAVARYVLEVASGSVARFGWRLGSPVVFR